MHSHFLPFRNGRIHYLQYGEGPELLIALHGFGDWARMFAVPKVEGGRGPYAWPIYAPF